MKLKLLALSLIICVLFSCSKNLTEPAIVTFDGESKPEGPLKVTNSKPISAARYPINTNISLETTTYEYYPDGNIKTKSRTSPGSAVNYVTNYYYNTQSNLTKEIVSEGITVQDTIDYIYNSDNKLVQKITRHSARTWGVMDTVFYKYNANGQLSEWSKRNGNEEYTTCWSEKNEYSDNLLVKTESYMDNVLLRTYNYKYYHGILTEKRVYMNNRLENRNIYYYLNGLLMNVKGYFANSETFTDQIIYVYNNRDELVREIVNVPPVSSSTDYEIHYEY